MGEKREAIDHFFLLILLTLFISLPACGETPNNKTKVIFSFANDGIDYEELEKKEGL